MKKEIEIEWECSNCQGFNVHLGKNNGKKYQCQHCNKKFSKVIDINGKTIKG